jgi:hypothetical protein
MRPCTIGGSISKGSRIDQHELTRAFMALFHPLADCVCASEALVADLKTAVDLAVHFFFFLVDWKSPSAVPPETCLDEMRIDISARAESINLLGLAVRGEIREAEPKLPWQPPISLSQFREECFCSFALMSCTDTSKRERYLHLLQICKLLLIFYGVTFI